MKINLISKLSFFTLILMCHLSSFGQNRFVEFSLKCKVKVEHTSPSGNKKIDNTEVIVEVNEFPKYKSIFLISSNEFVNNISVSTVSLPPRKGYEESSQDTSNESKYEITQNRTTPGNLDRTTNLYLNRNNGEIVITTEFTSPLGVSQTSIGGTCEKIDKTKKKF